MQQNKTFLKLFKTFHFVQPKNTRIFFSKNNKKTNFFSFINQQKRFHLTSNDHAYAQHKISSTPTLKSSIPQTITPTITPTITHNLVQESFYRRKLPSPPAIAFSSLEGKLLFREALELGYMEGYFNLAEQYRTQDEPQYCGLTTLTMVLNALSIDPKRIWKGPWRWYAESMLDGCRKLEDIKTDGISFDQVACLGRCHGLNIQSKRPNKRLVCNFETNEIIIKNQISNMNHDDTNSNENGNDFIECNSDKFPFVQHQHEPLPNQRYYSVEQFRDDIKKACSSSFAPIIIVSYSRQFLQQTGEGHYSPIGGYHNIKDMVLIMDVARFKYPPHWIPLTLLYDAMCCVDNSTQQTRGWMVVKLMDKLQPP